MVSKMGLRRSMKRFKKSKYKASLKNPVAGEEFTIKKLSPREFKQKSVYWQEYSNNKLESFEKGLVFLYAIVNSSITLNIDQSNLLNAVNKVQEGIKELKEAIDAVKRAKRIRRTPEQIEKDKKAKEAARIAKEKLREAKKRVIADIKRQHREMRKAKKGAR